MQCPHLLPPVRYQAFPHRLLQHKHSGAIAVYGLLTSREDFTASRRAAGCKDFVLSSLRVSSLLLSTAAEHFPAEHKAMRRMSPSVTLSLISSLVGSVVPEWSKRRQ